jgi:hypothetical protein
MCAVVVYTLREVFLYTWVLFLNAAQCLVTAPKHEHSQNKRRVTNTLDFQSAENSSYLYWEMFGDSYFTVLQFYIFTVLQFYIFTTYILILR